VSIYLLQPPSARLRTSESKSDRQRERATQPKDPSNKEDINVLQGGGNTIDKKEISFFGGRVLPIDVDGWIVLSVG
jgi:hypothetical protein